MKKMRTKEGRGEEVEVVKREVGMTSDEEEVRRALKRMKNRKAIFPDEFNRHPLCISKPIRSRQNTKVTSKVKSLGTQCFKTQKKGRG